MGHPTNVCIHTKLLENTLVALGYLGLRYPRVGFPLSTESSDFSKVRNFWNRQAEAGSSWASQRVENAHLFCIWDWAYQVTGASLW